MCQVLIYWEREIFHYYSGLALIMANRQEEAKAYIIHLFLIFVFFCSFFLCGRNILNWDLLNNMCKIHCIIAVIRQGSSIV